MHDLVEDYEGKEEGIHELETQILKLEESIERTNTKIALEFAEKKEALEKELEQLNRKCEEKTDKAIAHERYALEPLQWDLQERNSTVHYTKGIILQREEPIINLAGESKTIYEFITILLALHFLTYIFSCCQRR